MNVNNGTYYNYYRDKGKYVPVRTVKKKPVERELDLLEEVITKITIN